MNYETVYRRKPGRRKGSVAHNKSNLETVNARLAPRGIVCLGPYVCKETKAPFTAPCGHQWEARVGSVLRGRGCPECNGKKPLTKESLNARIQSKGILCLDEVPNNRELVRFQCGCGNVWRASADTIQRNSCTGCPECAKYKRRPKHSIEEVNARLSERGIICLEYVRMDMKSLFLAPCGHQWRAVTYTVVNGGGCPECATFGLKRNEPCYLYLMYSDESGIANFGVSKNLKIRRGQHSNDDKVEYQILRAKRYASGSSALQAERRVVEKMRQLGELPVTGSREKFRIPVNEAVDLFDLMS